MESEYSSRNTTKKDWKKIGIDESRFDKFILDESGAPPRKTCEVIINFSTGFERFIFGFC